MIHVSGITSSGPLLAKRPESQKQLNPREQVKQLNPREQVKQLNPREQVK